MAKAWSSWSGYKVFSLHPLSAKSHLFFIPELVWELKDRQTWHRGSVWAGPHHWIGKGGSTMLHSHFLIIRQQVSCVKTTPWEGPHKYALQTACIFTCMDGPLEPYSWWELAWTPNPLCRAAVGVNTAVTKHVSRSIPDTGIGDSPRDQRWAKDGNPIPIRKSRTLASVANVIGSSCDTAAMCWGLFLRNGIVELESGRILLASVWEMSWTEPKTCWGTARFSSELRETGTLTSTPRNCGFAHITASTQENLFSQTLKGTFVASIPFCGSIWDTDCLPYYQCVSILAWPRGLCGAPQLHTGEARITEGHCPRGHATGGTLWLIRLLSCSSGPSRSVPWASTHGKKLWNIPPISIWTS